jgi:hypothetical protein
MKCGSFTFQLEACSAWSEGHSPSQLTCRKQRVVDCHVLVRKLHTVVIQLFIQLHAGSYLFRKPFMQSPIGVKEVWLGETHGAHGRYEKVMSIFGEET